MTVSPNKTSYFSYKREEGQNPYTGIMSFQHFRGEKMYSDIVVRPEANFCETERVECYPPSPDAEERTRDEGYYPANTVVYIRVLWREFEPERGRYNYDFIDSILAEAKSHGQTLIFRLMAHSTRASDDVPEWLRSLVECPLRPDGERVKDSPTDPLFLDLFLDAVKALGERYDSDPWFDAIDISLPGAWGEGHNLHLYPANTLKRIVDVYLKAFPNTQLLTQASRPELLRYGEKRASIGWRGDGLGEPTHTFGAYPERIAKISDVWRKAPVSFESYWWLGEWERRGWDIDRIIEQTLAWHITSFNPKSMPIPEKWREKVDHWISRMGYHICPTAFSYPDEAHPSDKLSFSLSVSNLGVAPIYKPMKLKMRLRSDKDSFVFDTPLDVRRWLPGEYEEQLSLELPPDIPEGEYSLELAIVCELFPVVYLACSAERYGAFYKMGDIRVKK